MTIPAAEAARISYTGNGATTTFAFGWTIGQASDLRVEVAGLLVTNYSVTGQTVIFGTAPASGASVVITLSENAIMQDYDLSAIGTLNLTTLEAALDRQTNESRYLLEVLHRAMVMPRSTGLTQVPFPSPATLASAFLKSRSDGLGYELVANSPVTDLGNFTASGTGAVPRTVTAKLGDWVSVKDFGALGDDATDDTTAIQNAINAVALVSIGGTVYFPTGIYRVTQVSLPSNMTLLGSGPRSSVLKRAAGTGANFTGIVTNTNKGPGDTDLVLRHLGFQRSVEVNTGFDEHVYFENVTRVLIEGCFFLGTITISGTHTQKGIHLRGCSQARILGNAFLDLPDNAIALNFLGATTLGHHVIAGNTIVRTSNTDGNSAVIVTQSHVTIQANAFKGPATISGNWVESGQGNAVNITNLALVGNTVVGFSQLIHGCTGLVIAGNTLSNANIHVDTVADNCADVLVADNIVRGGGTILIKQASNVLVIGNKVDSSSAGNSGIRVDTCAFAAILHNHCRNNNRSGINVTTVSLGPLLVAQNVCYSNGQGGAADDWFGIFVDNSNDATIRGNVCFDTGATQRHGIGVNGGVRLTLIDNLSRDNSIGAYRELNVVSSYARRLGNIFNGACEEQKQILTATSTFDPPSLADGANATTTIAVTGALVGDPVWVGFSLDLQKITLTAYVSVANLVTVVFQNESGGVLDLGSGTLRVAVVRF